VCWKDVVFVQAIQFDVEQMYKSRLEVALHRLQLRTQLYTKPERSEDVAAVIIEQVSLCSYFHFHKRGYMFASMCLAVNSIIQKVAGEF